MDQYEYALELVKMEVDNEACVTIGSDRDKVVCVVPSKDGAEREILLIDTKKRKKATFSNSVDLFNYLLKNYDDITGSHLEGVGSLLYQKLRVKYG